MFSPNSESLCVILLSITVSTFGSWSSVRTLCRAEAPVFAILFLSSQFLTAIAMCLTLGMSSNVDDENFNSDVFVNAMGPERYSGGKAFCIVIGGFLLANGDFLCACACSHIPSAIAFPVYSGWGLVQGTVLNYIIESRSSSIDPVFLFLGIACALLAIGCMALSERYSKQNKNHISGADDGGFELEYKNNGLAMVDKSHETDAGVEYHNTSDNLLGQLSSSAEIVVIEQATPREYLGINIWVYVCLLGGVSSGLWSPLASYGRSGDGAVNDAFVSLFYFMCGQLCALPVMLIYFGKFISSSAAYRAYIRAPKSGKLPLLNTIYSTWLYYFSALASLTKQDTLYGMFAGCLVGVGYTFFFVTTEVITSTIAFAIASCDPLVAILLGVIVFCQLKSAPFLEIVFLVLSAVLFCVAIALMVTA